MISFFFCIQINAHMPFDRFDPADKDALAAKIEDDIYCRRITDAQQGLEQLKNAPIDDINTERYV